MKVASVAYNCATASAFLDATAARIIDLDGYGGASFFEGTAPAPGLSSTTAALRAGSVSGDSRSHSAA